jgi:hypothetical protein
VRMATSVLLFQLRCRAHTIDPESTPQGDNHETKSLRGLYLDELRDLYSAENQLVKALPKMAKAATSPQLKTG